MTPNMVRRVAFAAVAIPGVIAIAWVGHWIFAVFLGIAGVLGTRELYDLARKQGIEPLGRLGLAGAALAPLATATTLFTRGLAYGLIQDGYLFLLFVLVVMAVAIRRRGPTGKPLGAVAVTIFGAVYASWLLSFALVLRHPHWDPDLNDHRVGMALLFFPLVLTWVGDSAAMTGGRAFGGAKMAPVVSPNKTWAGGFSGLFGTMAVSLIYAAVVFRAVGVSVSLGEALVLGAAISVAGQVGDVAESLFKREVGVKDSSSLLPGHGGVLDRLDSLYFVLPMTSLLYRVTGIV
ncbi:MAG TPA: phosphatidate cytidylyltransferase [Gemmatimonadales bacterium]|jgi:phosphatidate cytidylyltransferase